MIIMIIMKRIYMIFTKLKSTQQENQQHEQKRILNFILKNIPRRYVNISWTAPRKSMIECALSRGDQRIGEVIEGAWKRGAGFDNWTDCFKHEIWEEEFKKAGLDIDFFTTRGYSSNEILPWDVVDIGVSKKFLLKEYGRSRYKLSLSAHAG